MKKTPILFLWIVMSAPPCIHAQQIADVLANNDDGLLTPLAEGTFIPDRPTCVPQHSISSTGGLQAVNNSVIDMTGVHGTGVDIAAYNTISGPSGDINIGWCCEDQVPILIHIMDASSNVLVGSQSTSYFNWGGNNFTANPVATDGFQPVIGSEATIDLGNIDDNIWGIGVDPTSYGSSPCTNCKWNSGTTMPYQINAQATTGNTISYVANYLGDVSVPSISCGTGWGGGSVTKKSNKPLSIQNDSSSACTQLYYSGYLASKSQLWQQTFDSLTLFIDSCPNNPNSIHAFQLITDAVVALNGPYGGNYRDTYLGWLERVLYLNTKNPEYFCACAEQIAGFLPLPHDTLPGYQSRETNIALAIDYWLIHNTTCDTPGLSQEYDRSRQTQLDQWSNDPGAYKLDTTLPPLDSIQQGLLELLEKHLLYATVSGTPPLSILSNPTANPNPTGEGTVISFHIAKEAYVKIELFNVLGREVSSAGFESLFEPGNKSVPISLVGLPSGTYFARILTAYGEVQSVKLVKE